MTQSASLLQNLTKAAVVVLFAAVWWFVYDSINARNSRPDRAVFLKPRPCDLWPGIIQPSTAIVYTLISAVLLIWPLVLSWETNAYRKLMSMMALGSVIGLAVCAAWPVNIHRPQYSGKAFGEGVMRMVFAIDHSANCFPSFHTFFAVLGAIVMCKQSTSITLDLLAIIFASSVMVSTITTGQHYLMDLLGGAALAVGSYWVIAKWVYP